MIRTGVVGVGYLGRFHAQKYAALEGSRLVAVADPDTVARQRITDELGVQAVPDHRQLIGQVDAVSIVTTTPTHHAVALDFLEAGVDVLLEKPITVAPQEAAELVELARRRGRILQVGHLERFNAVIQAATPRLRAPRFIESARLAPFRQRGTEVDVVLDLMIHDIDLILSMVRSPVTSVDAVGSSVFSSEIDIANARLRFENGCVANATASRVSLKTERKLRVFEDDAYLSVDLQQKILTVIRKADGPVAEGMPPVSIDERQFEQGDALKEEIAAFLHSVRTREKPLVSGEDGLLALEMAVQITDQVRRSRARFTA